MRLKHFWAFLSFLAVLANGAGCGPKESAVIKKEVRIWHWMTDRDKVFQELAKKYEEINNIKVIFELYAPSDAYAQKVRAAAQGNNLPDIFGVLGEKRDFASFIKAGHISDLSEYLQEQDWKKKFYPKALAVNEFSAGNSYGVKPGIYGIPIDIMTIMLVYNQSLFQELGLDPNKPPATWEEFLALGPKIKKAGKQGLVSGWGEIWLIDCFANNYAFNIMGKDKVIATIKGKVPYTDPDWIKVFSLFKEMQESGLLYNGLISMVNKTAEQLFANGKAVFAFNGSWCVNVYQNMNPDLKFGAFTPPRVSLRFPVSIWGGAGSSFMANDRSANKKEAVKFLKWLTDNQQQAVLAEKTKNLPSNRESVAKISPVLAQFASGTEYATHPSVWGTSEFSPVIEAFDKGIQSIIIGEKTPEQAAVEVQKVKERELAKKRG